MKLIKLFVIFFLLSSTYAMAENAVIVNPSNGSEISVSDVKKLFLGKRGAFNDGTKAKLSTIVVGSKIRETFNTEILNKSESQYTAYWAKLAFTGRGVPPKEFESSEALKKYIAETPNAIGIIDAAAVDDSVRKVLAF